MVTVALSERMSRMWRQLCGARLAKDQYCPIAVGAGAGRAGSAAGNCKRERRLGPGGVRAPACTTSRGND